MTGSWLHEEASRGGVGEGIASWLLQAKSGWKDFWSRSEAWPLEIQFPLGKLPTWEFVTGKLPGQLEITAKLENNREVTI